MAFWVQYTKMDKDANTIKQKVRQELANYLGVDIEDIEDESVLSEDLHMTALDLTDFTEKLISKGFDTSRVELTEIETFADLIENMA